MQLVALLRNSFALLRKSFALLRNICVITQILHLYANKIAFICSICVYIQFKLRINAEFAYKRRICVYGLVASIGARNPIFMSYVLEPVLHHLLLIHN